MESLLKEGLTYTGLVMSIRECVDSFKKTSTQGMGYCHKVEIKVVGMGDDLYTTQICTDVPHLEWFEPNDTIKFIASKFSKNIWTIKFVERKPKTIAVTPVSSVSASVSNEVTHETVSDQPWVSNNPVVAGTAIEKAYAHAAHFLQMRGNVSDEQYIILANKIYNDMVSKIK